MRVAIVGSGPAGLMAADIVSAGGVPVTLYEKRKGLGRKLLIAGSSGLNITHALAHEEFIRHYGEPRGFWEKRLREFSPADWVGFIERQLGIPTFVGTSARYFVENMKASRMLQSWRDRLEVQGVVFRPGREIVDFEASSAGGGVTLRDSEGESVRYDAVGFALGGGSYEPQEMPLRWVGMFQRKAVAFEEFRPSNVGYHLDWKPEFLKEAEGLPIKGVVLRTSKGEKQGEVVVTRYGLEGTPVYFVGCSGPAWLDLKPDLSAEQVRTKLSAVRENLSVMRRMKKTLSLDPAALALLFHHGPQEILRASNLVAAAQLVKAFPLELLEPRPLSESISSSGGIRMSELDLDSQMLKFHPGIFLAGEMLDWDVPTGGFWIQGCVATGAGAGRGILAYLNREHF